MKVFVADNSDLLRRRLISLFSELPGVQVVGEARDAREALQAIRATMPDVITLDIEMIGGSGIEVLREIKREAPAPVVLMLTNQVSPPYRQRCADAGADFFLDKTSGLKSVRDIFQTLMSQFEPTVS